MVHIRCIKPTCTCPFRRFEWDASTYELGDSITTPQEQRGSFKKFIRWMRGRGTPQKKDPRDVRVAVPCPCCDTVNIIRLPKELSAVVTFAR